MGVQPLSAGTTPGVGVQPLPAGTTPGVGVQPLPAGADTGTASVHKAVKSVSTAQQPELEPDGVNATAATIDTATAACTSTPTSTTKKMLDDPVDSTWATVLNDITTSMHPAVSIGDAVLTPAVTVGTAAVKTIEGLLLDLLRRLVDMCDKLHDRSSKGVVVAVQIVYPGELAKHGVNEVHKSYKAKIELICRRALSSAPDATSKHDEDDAFVLAISRALEYIAYEILELCGNCARDNKASEITPRHLYLAISNDEELTILFSKICFANAGVTVESRYRYYTRGALRVPFGLKLREAVEECSLHDAREQAAAGHVVDALTGWRLCRRAGIMYAEIGPITAELNALVEGVVAEVWSAAGSVSDMQNVIMSHPLLDVLAIAPADDHAVVVKESDTNGDNGSDGSDDKEDAANDGSDDDDTGDILEMSKLLEPIGLDAGLKSVGDVLKLEEENDFYFEEFEFGNEDTLSPIPCEDQDRLYEALRGPSKEALLALMTELDLDFDHLYTNQLSILPSPQSIIQFIFVNQKILSPSIQSCLIGWAPDDTRHKITTLLPVFKPDKKHDELYGRPLYFAVGDNATLTFPLSTGPTSVSVPAVARARMQTIRRHEHGAMLDQTRLRALVMGHAAGKSGFKVDDQALATLEVALSYRLATILEHALATTFNRRRLKVCLKDVKMAMAVTTCKLRCSINTALPAIETDNTAIAGDRADDEPEWGKPLKPRPHRPNPVDQDGKYIHLEASKSKWLRVTEAGARAAMDLIVTTPHAANAVTSIMRSLTLHHSNPPDVDRRWNCFAKVRVYAFARRSRTVSETFQNHFPRCIVNTLHSDTTQPLLKHHNAVRSVSPDLRARC